MPRARRPKPPVAGLTEKQVTAQCHDAARAYGLKLVRQNVGGMTNASGRYVAFGEPGSSDWKAEIAPGHGPNATRVLFVEIKRGGFDPRKLRGAKKAHFARQLAWLKARNAAGHLALWVSDGGHLALFLARVMDTANLRVEFDAEGYPVMTDHLLDGGI